MPHTVKVLALGRFDTLGLAVVELEGSDAPDNAVACVPDGRKVRGMDDCALGRAVETLPDVDLNWQRRSLKANHINCLQRG